jgi:serine/threonine-protein kinase RIO1
MIGINTPHPCLFFEERILWHFRSRAFFLSENIKALNLLDYMNSRVLKDAEITLIIDAFKRLFKLMIYYKISHGDMKATNFILHENKLFVLDLDSMSRHRNPYFFRRAIQKDLDRFLKNWTGGKYESEFERVVASIEFPV